MLPELGGAPQPPAPQEMGAGASRPEPRHRSVHSRLPSTALFVNDTRHAVRTVWLDYRGRERAYALLQPGESYRQQSYCCHPWRFQAEGTTASPVLVAGGQQVVYLQPDADVVHITEAAPVPWGPATHARFPPDFQQRVQALLLSWHRCSRAPPAAATAAPYSTRRRYLPSCVAAKLGRLCDPGELPAEAGACSAAGGVCTLGSLPQELVLAVLQLAAPYVPHVVRPALPPSANEGDYSPEERAVLFSG